MTKTKTIIISILLITSALIIKTLSNSQPANELIGFFSGIVFGVGVVIFVQTIFKKKTDINQ
jgi:membrane protein CcdC involved in cytochrome C biogenesis